MDQDSKEKMSPSVKKRQQQENFRVVAKFADTPDNWRKLSRYISDVTMMEQLKDKLDFEQLSYNPHAVPFLEKYPEKIDWFALSSNRKAIHLLCENIEKIDWVQLSGNTNATVILAQHPEKIFWSAFCSHSVKANIQIISQHLQSVDWDTLSSNAEAMEILLKNRDKINWDSLSRNKAAVRFLRDNPKRINWNLISLNQSNSQSMLDLFRENSEKLNYAHLSSNPSDRAVDFLLSNPERIVWKSFCSNTNPRAISKIYNSLTKNPAFFEPVDNPNCPIAMTRGLHLNIHWKELSRNPSAVSLLEKYPDDIDLSGLLSNSSPFAYILAFENIDMSPDSSNRKFHKC
jgi:hypothetical protein